MHNAGEPWSVYGNPCEQGGLPSFLILLLTVLGYGLRCLFMLPVQCPSLPPSRLLFTFTTTFSYSPFLHFCDIGDSAARRQPLRCRETSPGGFKWSLYQRRDQGECRDVQRGRRQVRVSSAIFIMVITAYSMELTPRLFSSYTFGS